jgi:hypothetical protein
MIWKMSDSRQTGKHSHYPDCGSHDLVQLRLPDRQVSILTIQIAAAMIQYSSDFSDRQVSILTIWIAAAMIWYSSYFQTD